jgi:16S rRNA (uracil1498-N3)-methyltransferase
MELYFTNSENIAETEAEFDSFESRHILKTMRKKEGDSIHFTDGRGCLYLGRIVATKPLLKVQHELVKQLHWPPPTLTILGIGFIRPSRMDFLIEKTTELGVNRFYIFSSHFTTYFTKNSVRWEKIARQAIKQSNRLYMPDINISADYKKFINDISSIQYKFIAEQAASKKVTDILKKNLVNVEDNIVFIIGPEGGFDTNELNLAQKQGFVPLSFGEHRLRTETAAISAAFYINLLKN